MFAETPLKGAYVIELERLIDSRGFFARTFCRKQFEAHGINPDIAQTNVALNRLKGTIRGMHFQYPPRAESKVVRCTRGAILDIIVDLRPESRTYLQHFCIELSQDNYRALYVPERFAHGYQTLEDHTEATYQMGEYYAPGSGGGLRYDDVALGLKWPIPMSVISEQDAAWPLFETQRVGLEQLMYIDA